MNNGHLISQTRGGTTDYYLTDAQGSVRALTDASGATLNTYDYTAYGDLVAQTGTAINPYLLYTAHAAASSSACSSTVLVAASCKSGCKDPKIRTDQK